METMRLTFGSSRFADGGDITEAPYEVMISSAVGRWKDSDAVRILWRLCSPLVPFYLQHLRLELRS